MRSLSLVALLALTACSYDPDKSDITVTVNNISQAANVNHLDVTLTLADGPHVYHPTFGQQSTTSVDLSLSSGGQTGTFTLKVEQFDRNSTSFGSTTVNGTLTPPTTVIPPVALPPALVP